MVCMALIGLTFLIFMLGALLLAIRIVMAIIIYLDTEGYQTNRWAWALVGLFGGFLGLLIWFTVNNEIPHAKKTVPVPQTYPWWPPPPYQTPGGQYPRQEQYAQPPPSPQGPHQGWGYGPAGGWGYYYPGYYSSYYRRGVSRPGEGEKKEGEGGGVVSKGEEKV